MTKAKTFDPDAYLSVPEAETEGGGASSFNPDAWLADADRAPQNYGTSKLDAALEHFGKGASLGALPYLQAPVEGAVDGLSRLLGVGTHKDDAKMKKMGFEPQSLDPSQLVAENKERQAMQAHDNPATALAANFAGGLASAPLVGAGVSTVAQKVLPTQLYNGGAKLLEFLGKSAPRRALTGGTIGAALDDENRGRGFAVGAGTSLAADAAMKGLDTLASGTQRVARALGGGLSKRQADAYGTHHKDAHDYLNRLEHDPSGTERAMQETNRELRSRVQNEILDPLEQQVQSGVAGRTSKIDPTAFEGSAAGESLTRSAQATQPKVPTTVRAGKGSERVIGHQRMEVVPKFKLRKGEGPAVFSDPELVGWSREVSTPMYEAPPTSGYKFDPKTGKYTSTVEFDPTVGPELGFAPAESAQPGGWVPTGKKLPGSRQLQTEVGRVEQPTGPWERTPPEWLPAPKPGSTPALASAFETPPPNSSSAPSPMMALEEAKAEAALAQEKADSVRFTQTEKGWGSPLKSAKPKYSKTTETQRLKSHERPDVLPGQKVVRGQADEVVEIPATPAKDAAWSQESPLVPLEPKASPPIGSREPNPGKYAGDYKRTVYTEHEPATPAPPAWWSQEQKAAWEAQNRATPLYASKTHSKTPRLEPAGEEIVVDRKGVPFEGSTPVHNRLDFETPGPAPVLKGQEVELPLNSQLKALRLAQEQAALNSKAIEAGREASNPQAGAHAKALSTKLKREAPGLEEAFQEKHAALEFQKDLLHQSGPHRVYEAHDRGMGSESGRSLRAAADYFDKKLGTHMVGKSNAVDVIRHTDKPVTADGLFGSFANATAKHTTGPLARAMMRAVGRTQKLSAPMSKAGDAFNKANQTRLLSLSLQDALTEDAAEREKKKKRR